jgi:hypothetical protein
MPSCRLIRIVGGAFLLREHVLLDENDAGENVLGVLIHIISVPTGWWLANTARIEVSEFADRAHELWTVSARKLETVRVMDGDGHQSVRGSLVTELP